MKTINAKELRASLPDIVRRVQRGERFLVLYRSRPAFELVPASGASGQLPSLETDPIYKAGPVGRSTDGKSSVDHDAELYGEG